MATNTPTIEEQQNSAIKKALEEAAETLRNQQQTKAQVEATEQIIKDLEEIAKEIADDTTTA